ncbi:MAG: DUF4129 domain-containing protein [Pseudomonadota bacterium]
MIQAFALAPVQAQEAPPRITLVEMPENPDYARSIRFSRLQSRLNYVEEASGPIPMDAAAGVNPPAPPSQSEAPRLRDWTALEILSRVALLIVLALIAFAIVKHGGALTARFRNTGDGSSGTGRGDPHAVQEPAIPLPEADALLARLRAMPNREEALILLIGHTLEAAGRQNALRLRRSETAREFLNRLPVSWPRLADLRRITMAEELVQFGGRPLAENTFEDCLRRAHPILSGPPA